MCNCSKCGKVFEDNNFCKYCGVRLNEAKASMMIIGLEEEIKKIIVRRFNSIKNRDENAVRPIIVADNYSKFHDWPLFELKSANEALKNEFI